MSQAQEEAENTTQEESDQSPDGSWVLDSLVGFLKSSIWNLPLVTFVEQKSVVFEPDDAAENEEEYKKIFEEYKNLVDHLLGGHMEDLGISPQQFEEACARAEGTLSAKFHTNLFEQIWAANDLEIFKRMMIRRNIDLQLQALEVLAQRHGLVPESFIPDGSSSSREGFLRDEELLMEVVMKRSLQQLADERKLDQQESGAYEEAIEATLEEKGRLEAEKERETEMLDRALHEALILSEGDAGRAPKDCPKPLKLSSAPTPSPAKGGLGSEEIKKRQEYLRNQRDKLLKIKKKEREKQLVRMEESERLAMRPKSAKALMSSVEGQEQRDQSGSDADSGLAFRRSLAARLKAEVVEGNQE